MYQVQVNKERLRNHIQYDWWKYIVGIVLTVLLWSMVTAMTQPRTPADQKIEIFLVGDYAMDEPMEEISNEVLDQFSNLLEVNVMNIPTGEDSQMDYVGRQKLMVMLGSQTGDLYAFEKEEFKQMAEQGAFLPLDEHLDQFKGYVNDEELEKYKLTALEDSEAHYYGIPMEGIGLFNSTGYDSSDKVIGVMAYSKNQSTAIDVLKWILNDGSKQ